MNCRYHRVRSKKGVNYGYCSLLRQEVDLFGCRCDSFSSRDYKGFSSRSGISTRSKLSTRKSSRISQLERNRFSILTDDLSRCFICGKPKEHLHELYEGAYRSRSMKYGCVIPLCSGCHHMIHLNHDVAVKYKELCEARFSEVYPDLVFSDLFYYKH